MKCKITLFYLYNATHQTKANIDHQALNKLLVDPKTNIMFYINTFPKLIVYAYDEQI